MKLACPECGCQFSLPVATNDVAARQVSKTMAEMPRVVGLVITQYLALFRPEKTSLRWPRVLKLLQEIQPQISASTINRNGNTRRAPAELWAESMRQMLEQKNKLTLPLKSHGYLYEVVYRLADKQAAADESAHISNLRHRGSDGETATRASDLTPKHLKLNALKNELQSLERLIDSSPSAQLSAQAGDIEIKIAKLEGTL